MSFASSSARFLRFFTPSSFNNGTRCVPRHTTSCLQARSYTRLSAQSAPLCLSQTRPVLSRSTAPYRRHVASSRAAAQAALAEQTSSEPTVLLAYPTPSSLQHDQAEAAEDEDEPDIELLQPEEARLEITNRAAEQLRAIAKRENNPDAALRVVVESGGCHGYQYKMQLAAKREPDDYQFSHPTLKPSNILIDAVSLTLLKGSTIDFATELIGSSFRVVDNPQAQGSGCGCGVSWELKA